MRFAKRGWWLLKETIREFRKDKVPRLAAALAFYTIFSMAPLLLIAVAVTGLVFSEAAAQGHIVAQVEGLVGSAGARTIEGILESARSTSSGVFATVIGLVTLIYGASGAFGQAQDALNTIWDVPKRPAQKAKGLKGLLLSFGGALRNRVVSFTLVLGVGFLLLVTLVISAGLEAFGDKLESTWSGVSSPVLQVTNVAISLAVITTLFAAMFKILPDTKIRWREVWLGAFVTALLFSVGKYLIGFYLGRTAFSTAYGAAGSFVILLSWIYYSSLILFLGAEFTQVHARGKERSEDVPVPV